MPSRRDSAVGRTLISLTLIVVIAAIGAVASLSLSPQISNCCRTHSLNTTDLATTTSTLVTNSIVGTGDRTCNSLPCVQGFVSVGPLCPAEYASTTVVSGVTTAVYGCGTNTVVSVMYDQYYLSFQPIGSKAGAQSAYLNSTGYYDISIQAGTYTVTMPGCPWMGCNQVFPLNVTILQNQITISNLTIDTGIR